MLEVAKLQPDNVTFAFDVYFQMETTFINTKKNKSKIVIRMPICTNTCFTIN
jgi:hypothetical protein